MTTSIGAGREGTKDGGAALADPPLRWTDRIWRTRDRLLASRNFQRWASVFPLTRFTSRRRARELFDLVAGFAYSQVLLACVRLQLFEFLFERSRSLHEVVEHTGLESDAALRLLEAAISLRLVARRRGDRYGLGALGAPMVGNTAVQALIEHHDAFYADLADPVALLRGLPSPTQLARLWPYADAGRTGELEPVDVAAYSTLMSASQPLVAEQILQAFPLHGHRCLLDVGGGEGRFLQSALQCTPKLRGMLFDLPAVAARARERWTGSAEASRLQAWGGDFRRDALPDGADIVSLVRVVHDHDDAPALALLRAVHAALPTRGTLLIAEPMAGTPGAQAMGGAYFGLYLWAMGQGRARNAEQLAALVRAAGFSGVRLLRNAMPLQTQVMVAHRA